MSHLLSQCHSYFGSQYKRTLIFLKNNVLLLFLLLFCNNRGIIAILTEKALYCYVLIVINNFYMKSSFISFLKK